MTPQMEADMLREWLDAQRPFTMLDIRTDEDRAMGRPWKRPCERLRSLARRTAGRADRCGAPA